MRILLENTAFARDTYLGFLDLEHLLVLLCILLYGLIEEKVRSAHPDAMP